MSQASGEDNDYADPVSPESPMTPDGMILARMPWHPGLEGNWNTVKSVSTAMLNGDETDRAAPSDGQQEAGSSSQIGQESRKTVVFQEPDTGFPNEHDQLTALHDSEEGNRKMSLVGKPLTYKNYRTDQRFRRMQNKMHNFLERPRGWKAASYHLAVLFMVLMCLALSVFSTMPDFEVKATIVLYYLEIVFVIWLATEYICRVWSAGCRSRYRGISGRIRFATSAYCVIDIIVILASITVLCIGATGQVFAASAIRGLRFFQILRMLRIDRRAGTWKLLGSVVWAHRQELLTTVYIGFLGLIFSSFLVYLCEKNTNDKYQTFADALWWGVITLSTVGYGDKTPETWPGKIIAAFCALLGISFFALPAGILGSGFALKVQQHQRQKHLIRRRIPAAKLIQCLWRHYSAAPESTSLATWKVHLARELPPIVKFTPNNGSNNATGLINRLRQSTKRSPNSQLQGPTSNFPSSSKNLSVPRVHDTISLVSTSDISEIEQLGALGFSLGWKSKSKYSGSRKAADDSVLQSRMMAPSNTNLDDMRRRSRRSASLCRVVNNNGQHLRPSQPRATLSDGDVIGDYSLMMAPIYQWCEQMVQRNSGPGEDGVWSQLSQLTTCATRRAEDISDGDEEENIGYQPQTMEELTPALKNCVRAIRRIQLLVARRKFKEALKPYDVKDVIEQYSAGHVDLQSRVKTVQAKLDIICGKNIEKLDPKISMYNRIATLENTVGKMDKKLDMMVELLMSRQPGSRVFSQSTSPRGEIVSEPNTGRIDLTRSRRSVASTDNEMYTARSHSPGGPAIRMAEEEDDGAFDETSPLNNGPSTSSC
ncbi:hypothetical protein L5515_018081 [Caenorhabditis briggsae]|uniref:Protein CBR-KQT-1 n=1 Tax=Caenorhabditis briggsae TaxID=6238 RepID=A0AAE9JRT5_CAEBR|nr:hypothetical protein L3Y34_012221 [Caenorhabditis briggsae]UMM42137.1 hypothetical protein L5515_018081 [Caenorhabditis briggsae]